MCGRSIWNWLRSDHEPIKLVFTVVAAIFVTWQYFQARDEGRTKQTMEFQARFSQGEVQAAYRDLSLLLIENKSQLDDAGPNANQVITQLVKSNQKDDKVILLANFYSQITTCVENDVCSKQVACAIFAKPVFELRNNFYDIFKRWEKDWGKNFIESSFAYFTNNCPR